jgi:CelD/BcsL family acetyltransferase involved in cellulose biosynthesis
MQQHIWVRAAAETMSSTEEVEVVTVGPPERPLALAPFCQSERGPTRLKLLSAEESGESVEVIYRRADALELLAKAIVRTALPVSFAHYVRDTPFIAALRRAYRGRGLVVTRALAARGNPSIALDERWIEPECYLNARRQSDLRRMRRNAEKLGKVEFEILKPRAEELRPLLIEAMAVEEKGWKGRAGTALAVDRRLRKFYQRYSELACDDGILRLCFMRIDGRAVAMQIAAEVDQRFWLLKIGFDEDYKNCSPGNLLMRETIAYAARHKLLSYEFLGKEAPWTKLWTQTAYPLTALRTYPFNLAGMAALAFDVSLYARRRLKELSVFGQQSHLPPSRFNFLLATTAQLAAAV